MFPTDYFITTNSALAVLLVPFATAYIATSCRDKLESIPLQKPLPQYSFLSGCESVCGGLFLMPDYIRSLHSIWIS